LKLTGTLFKKTRRETAFTYARNAQSTELKNIKEMNILAIN